MRILKPKIIAKSGFTIIELLVVIVIIGILATVSVVGYGAWRSSAITSQVKSDLNAIAAAMENARAFNNGYPTTLPTTVTPSGGVTLTLQTGSTVTAYCIDGVSSDNSTLTFYIASETKDQGALEGTCVGRIYLPTPNVPTGLAVVSSSDTQVNLSWDSVTNATTYTLQCATDAAYVSDVRTLSVSITTASVVSLTQNTTYFCRVNAMNASGQSDWSSNVSTFTVLTAPTGLAVTPVSPTQINYSWNAQIGATGYNVQRATNATFTTGLVTVNQVGLAGSSTGLSPGTTYYYRVQAVNASGVGAYSTSVNATTSLPAPVGVATSGVTSTQAVQPAYTGQATVSWTAVSGAVTYIVEHATNAAFTGSTTISGIATTSRTVTGLYQGQVNYFRVFAVGSSATSAASLSVTGTTPIAQPPAPSSGVANFSPAISHWANNQSVVVNWATYCPTNPITPISVFNPNFTSNDWPPPPINSYYHSFGFSDWWSTGQSGPTVTYFARYYCTNTNGTSVASPDSTTYVTIN